MKNNFTLYSLLFIVCFMLACSSKTRLIEKVTRTGKELVIPYEKYELENGLTLVIHEDHSDPVVHVDVTYHVGSAREELQKSGFAHFFEHMMFQGSENVADEEHIRIITEAGGTMNGTTNRDRTNYFETVPSNQLERVLWLEADRMGFFLDEVTQEKFEVQRATVKNEKGQSYDNAPYGPYWELNVATLYPYGHPYSWLTIGKVEDLDRVSVEDLKKFFLRWYGPNNATLSIGGDVDPKEVINLVEKYFATIPKGLEVTPMSLESVKLDKTRHVSYVDKNIRFPAVVFTYPTVPRFHPDEAPLDCLAEILGQGKSSYFYKKFVKTQQAMQASANHPASELAGEFTMFVLPFPGKTLGQFEQSIMKIFEEFEENGVTDEDVEKFKASMESDMIHSLESVSGKVTQLANFETFRGNPNGITNDLERYTSVTKEDVMRVFKTYIKDKSHVVVSILANKELSPAKPDNYEAISSGENPFPTTNYEGLVYNRPPKDHFDRSKKPGLGKNPVVKVPDFWKDNFDNGMKIIGVESNETPTVFVQLSINGGHKLDAHTPSKSGLAALTASILNESTKNYSAEQLQKKLQLLGSSINVSSSEDAIDMTISSLMKNIGATMELAKEILQNPKFDKMDFERAKKQQIEGILASQQQPSAIADQVYDKLLFGKNHIYGIQPEGEISSVKTITLNDVKAFYQNYFSPSVAELVVVGDISKEGIIPHLAFLKTWKKKDVNIPSVKLDRIPSKTKIYLVDKPKAPQSEIRVGYLTSLPYSATGDFYKSRLANFPLSGSFNSRINLNLREDKGWTYGARGRFSSDDEIGYFKTSTSVKDEATSESVKEILKELEQYQASGITDEEVNYVRSSIGQSDARKYETPSQKARFLSRIVHYDLEKDYVDQQNKIVKTISKEELNEIIKKYIHTTNAYILVVGDATSHKAKLKALGYEIVELTVAGERK